MEIAEPSRESTPFAGRRRLVWRLRRIWRQRLRPLWREMRAIVILALALAVVTLGTVGYMQEDGGNLEFSDALYKAIQLFGFGGGDLPTSAPTELNVARFLGPLLVGYAAIRGLLVLSRQQLRLLGFRLLRRNHVVVAGLGDVGFRLAKSLNEIGASRVIAIDSNPANPAFEGCRERGIGFLAGDATDPDILNATRVGQARYLVIACGIDGNNIDIAAAARRLATAKGKGTLTTYVHIEDRALWRALEARTLTEPVHPAFRLQLFNVYEAAVRLLLEEHPPFSEGSRRTSPHVLVAADHWYIETLVVNVARMWREIADGRASEARITIAGPGATQERDRVRAKHPSIDEIISVEAWETELTSAAIRSDPRAREATSVYVALADEAQGVAAAVLLASGNREAANVVLAVNDAELGAASTVAGKDHATGRIAVFGVLTRALDPGFLFRGLNENLARAMHESYRRGLPPEEKTPDNPSNRPWEGLPESLKESNRRFADGVGPKLQAVGCVAVPTPLVNLNEPSNRFTADEVELLAKMEHDRWMSDLVRDGWVHGPPPKSPDSTPPTHPLLVGWEDLSEADREKDRVAVRDLPQMLASAGFELHRVSGPERSPPATVE